MYWIRAPVPWCLLLWNSSCPTADYCAESIKQPRCTGLPTFYIFCGFVIKWWTKMGHNSEDIRCNHGFIYRWSPFIILPWSRVQKMLEMRDCFFGMSSWDVEHEDEHHHDMRGLVSGWVTRMSTMRSRGGMSDRDEGRSGRKRRVLRPRSTKGAKYDMMAGWRWPDDNGRQSL